jgi:hypothetical protein
MEHSATYIAMQDMIKHGLLGIFFSSFTTTVALLEEKGLITEAEGKGLLALADERKEHEEGHSWPTKPGDSFPISGPTDSVESAP